jgi:general secretion pathway protein F
MPSYHVAAVDTNGRLVEETLVATDRSAAVEAARDHGWTPISVSAAAGRPKLTFVAPGSHRRVRPSDLAFVFVQLSVLLKAGLELDRALTVAADMVSRAPIRQELAAMRMILREGRSLADYVASRPDTYKTFVAGAIRAGETSGAFDVTFEQIGKLLERQIAIRRIIVSALVYPCFLVLGSLASILILLTVVLPKFEPLFASSGAELPFATRALMAISDSAVRMAPFAAVAALSCFVLGRVWLRDRDNRRRWHAILLRLPVIGPLLLKVQLARYSFMMSTLLRAGLPILSALGTATQSLSNVAVAVAFEKSALMLRDGSPLSQALSSQGLFPDLFIQLLRVGEEAAKLDRSFLEIGEIYERDVTTDVERSLAMITPATTIVVGIVIAGIIAAILSAVLRINDLPLS